MYEHWFQVFTVSAAINFVQQTTIKEKGEKQKNDTKREKTGGARSWKKKEKKRDASEGGKGTETRRRQEIGGKDLKGDETEGIGARMGKENIEGGRSGLNAGRKEGRGGGGSSDEMKEERRMEGPGGEVKGKQKQEKRRK